MIFPRDQKHPIDMTEYSPDGTWDLEDWVAEKKSNDDGKSTVQFSLLLTRRKIFYIANIIIPVSLKVLDWILL